MPQYKSFCNLLLFATVTIILSCPPPAGLRVVKLSCPLSQPPLKKNMMSRHLFNHITDQLGTFRSAVFTWKDSWASIFFIHFFCSWHQARSYLLHIFIKLQTTKNTKSSLSGRMDTAQHFHLSNLHWWRTLGKWYSGPMVYGYTASMLRCLKKQQFARCTHTHMQGVSMPLLTTDHTSQ